MLQLVMFLLINTLSGLTTKPAGRMFHNCVLDKKTVWMLGGIQKPPGTNRTCLEDSSGEICEGMWKYDTQKNSWLHEEIGFPKRRGSSMVSNDNFIYVQGGGVANVENPIYSVPFSDMWRYTKKNGMWMEIKTNNPDIYLHQSIINARGHIYSLGGFDSAGKSKFLYIFNGETWIKENASPFMKNGIWGHSMTIVDDRYIYIIGGTCGNPTDKSSFNKDVWTYDTETKKWNLECGGIPLYGHTSCQVRRKLKIGDVLYSNDDIIITGGYYPTKMIKNQEGAEHLGGTVDNIYGFNTRTRMWKYMGKLVRPREFHSAILCDDKLFVFGGYHVGNFWESGEVVFLGKNS